MARANTWFHGNVTWRDEIVWVQHNTSGKWWAEIRGDDAKVSTGPWDTQLEAECAIIDFVASLLSDD